MKRIKFRLQKLVDKTKTSIKKAKEDHVIRKYIKNNKLFLTYVITCLVNATMLRFFCIHSVPS